MRTLVTIICPICGTEKQKELGIVNLAKKRGKILYCSVKCSGIGNGEKKRGISKPCSEKRLEAIRKAATDPKSKERKRLAHLGTKQSPEHTEAIRQAMNKPETLQKISEGVKKAYEDPEMKQRQYEATLSNLEKPEVRERISQGVQRALDNGLREKHKEVMNRPEVKQKISEANTGKKWTAEQKEKMPAIISANAKKRWANVSPEDRRAHMQAAIQASMSLMSSSLEDRTKSILDDLGVEYIQQYGVGPYFADFFFPEYNTVFELYGCFWHSCETCNIPGQDPIEMKKRRGKNRSREAYLRACGYTLVILWEHEMERLNDTLLAILTV